jgi:hypothetical protein
MTNISDAKSGAHETTFPPGNDRIVAGSFSQSDQTLQAAPTGEMRVPGGMSRSPRSGVATATATATADKTTTTNPLRVGQDRVPGGQS